MAPTEYTITPYADPDRRGLWELMLEITRIGQDDGTRAIRQASAERLMRSALSPNTNIAVARLDGRIVGYTETHTLNRHAVHFHRAAVHPEFRQRGIFTALMIGVNQWAGDRSIEADIHPERSHLKTMIRHGYRMDPHPSLEPGLIRIVRPGQPNVLKKLLQW